MSFLTITKALERGGAELILSNPVVAVFATRRPDGDVYWRVTEPGRVDVAGTPEGPWTAATYGITVQLDLVGRAVIDHQRRAAMQQLDLTLMDARAAAGTASRPNTEEARNRAKSGAGEAQHDPAPRAYLAAQSHSQTSIQAAQQALPNAGTQRRAVLDLLRRRGDGYTDEQIAEILRLNPSAERPRRVELVEAGLVKDSGAQRRTRSGRMAVVWQATGS